MRPLVNKDPRCGGDALRAELVDRAVERSCVQLAGRVLAERRQVRDAERLAARARGQLAPEGTQAPDRPAAVVAVEIAAVGRDDRPAAVDVAAGNRTALQVGIDDEREDERPARV